MLGRVRTMYQQSLFDRTGEKGSGEWNLATAVKHDRQAGMFRVATPQQPNTPRHGNIIPIRRIHTAPRFTPRTT